MKELELYLHIPFCERKCAYCDFLSAPADLPVRISYIKKLQEEIAYYGSEFEEYQVSSIFLGGGTPTILEGYQLAAILETVKKYFRLVADAEITVECNPGTLTAGKGKNWCRRDLTGLVWVCSPRMTENCSFWDESIILRSS